MSTTVGVIFSWNTERGYGFIEAGSGRRVFGHISAWESAAPPETGQRVVFGLVPSERGPKAVSIRLQTETEIGAGVNTLATPQTEVRS